MALACGANPLPLIADHRPQERQMQLFPLLNRLLAALHSARKVEASRMIRRHSHLVEEAHAYDRRCAGEAAGRRTAAAAAPIAGGEPISLRLQLVVTIV